MCFICDRIEQIKNGTSPYFVEELADMKRALRTELGKLTPIFPTRNDAPSSKGEGARKHASPEPAAETVFQETSPGGAFRYEVYRERGLFKVRTERRIEDDYMEPGWSGWIPASDMAHIADTLERAVELGRESLRCLDGQGVSGENSQ